MVSSSIPCISRPDKSTLMSAPRRCDVATVTFTTKSRWLSISKTPVLPRDMTLKKWLRLFELRATAAGWTDDDKVANFSETFCLYQETTSTQERYVSLSSKKWRNDLKKPSATHFVSSFIRGSENDNLRGIILRKSDRWPESSHGPATYAMALDCSEVELSLQIYS